MVRNVCSTSTVVDRRWIDKGSGGRRLLVVVCRLDNGTFSPKSHLPRKLPEWRSREDHLLGWVVPWGVCRIYYDQVNFKNQIKNWIFRIPSEYTDYPIRSNAFLLSSVETESYFIVVVRDWCRSWTRAASKSRSSVRWVPTEWRIEYHVRSRWIVSMPAVSHRFSKNLFNDVEP